MKSSYSGVFSISVLSTRFAHGPLRSRSGVGAVSIELSALESYDLFIFPFFFFMIFLSCFVNREFYSIGTLTQTRGKLTGNATLLK